MRFFGCKSLDPCEQVGFDGHIARFLDLAGGRQHRDGFLLHMDLFPAQELAFAGSKASKEADGVVKHEIFVLRRFPAQRHQPQRLGGVKMVTSLPSTWMSIFSQGLVVEVAMGDAPVEELGETAAHVELAT